MSAARARSAPATSTSRQPRFGARRTTPPSATRPGTARVTPTTRSPSRSAAATTSAASRLRSPSTRLGVPTTLVAASDLEAALASGEVEHAGGQIVHIDLKTEAGRAAGRRRPARSAGRPAPARGGGSTSASSPPPSSSSTRAETVALVSPVMPARSARETGPELAATLRSTSPRLCSRRLRCRTGSSRCGGGGGHALTMPHGRRISSAAIQIAFGGGSHG